MMKEAIDIEDIYAIVGNRISAGGNMESKSWADRM